MMPGKLFHRIFPNWITATHCSVNRLAYTALPRHLRKKHFPNWSAINEYEGVNGMDGLWLAHQKLPSRSAFNVDTHEGHGIEEAAEQYQALVTSWQQTNAIVAQQLAYTSHIITDICTPAHQHGRQIEPKLTSWYLWFTRDDWEEEGDTKNHIFFEMRMMYHLAFAQIGKIRVNARAVRNLLQSKRPSVTIEEILTREVTSIRQLNLYRQYVKQGWTHQLGNILSQRVVPRIASVVATMWLGSWLAARPKRIKRLPLLHLRKLKPLKLRSAKPIV